MLRGNFSAKIDEKGRLKIPTAFRTAIQDRYGTQLFVTSVNGELVLIYPLPVWEDIEHKLASVPSTLPARGKFFNRVNYFGQTGEFDKQGRVSIHTRLRETAAMVGEVDVFGQYDHLDVWNHERFATELSGEPFTDEDAAALSEYGI
ncbi:MAG: division/cell wall cluster transcriptional repressor MraZ [Acidobacteriota bacterium]|nr:division/cell wall cluster transcriptional repressor MraZ [Acidobacteriota bacterium]